MEIFRKHKSINIYIYIYSTILDKLQYYITKYRQTNSPDIKCSNSAAIGYNDGLYVISGHT